MIPDARRAHWYEDDQFAVQLGTVGRRRVIEQRWRRFEAAIAAWLEARASLAGGQSLRILDAGCGDGINLAALSDIAARRRVDSDIIGVDYNPLRLGRAHRLPNVRGLSQTSLTSLPFPDESFDIVLCNHVLEHIPDDNAALAELRRVTKRDGLVLIGVPNEGCALARLRNHVIQRSILSTTDHVHFYRSAELCRKMVAAGLAPVGVEREGFFLPHLGIATRLREMPLGRGLMEVLRYLFPGQAAGLMVVAHPARSIKPPGR